MRYVKSKTLLFVFFVVMCCGGCTNLILQKGADAYNQGNYDLAAQYWNPLAKQGNFAAQYNLGLLWEQGLGSTRKDKGTASRWFLLSAQQGYPPAMVKLARIQKEDGYNDAALSWLNNAARWGNSDAVNDLIRWGKPVPGADLLAQKQRRDVEANQNAMAAIITGVANGLSGANTSTSSIYDDDCSSDFSCGNGYKCVKAPGKSSGICMKSVDAFGQQQQNLPDVNSSGRNLNLNGQCSFNTDCPVGFRCDGTYRVCVK